MKTLLMNLLVLGGIALVYLILSRRSWWNAHPIAKHGPNRVEGVAVESEALSARYWVVPQDNPGLLRAMMQALAGGAQISLEGNLSRCDFPPHLRPQEGEPESLSRQIVWPRADHVVLPLEPDAVEPILEVILPALKDIIHIQIERHGELQFGAYDNFHDECVVCYGEVEPTLLDRLKLSGVIRSWQIAPAGEHRWHD